MLKNTVEDNNLKELYDNNRKIFKEAIKFFLIIVGIILYAIGLRWFVYGADILPSGFIGVSVLLQKLIFGLSGKTIPITVFSLLLNIVPAIMSYKIVGKKFTIVSFIILFLFTFLADEFPAVTLTNDPLVAAIFGGILCGFAGSLWLRCGVSGGGTDFIAMSLSAKWHIQTFGYIMAFNIILIIIQGILYGWNSAFYSIIYQFVSTTVLNASYRHYEARTIFIITDKPTLVSKMLIKESGHSSTRFDGIGCYTNNEKYMLYTVVTQPEVRRVTNIVKKYDPSAFVNVLRSNEVQGNFKYLPVEIDDIDENY